MARRQHATVRLSPDELRLLLAGLDQLDKEDRFTQSVQPAHSEGAIGAATRVQAVEMLRQVLLESL